MVFRRHHLIIVCCFCLSIVGSGCAGGAVLSEDAQRARKINSLVQELVTAYERKDIEHFTSLLPSSSPDLRMLAAAVSRDFREYEQIGLTLSIDRIILKGEKGEIVFHWEGNWKRPGARGTYTARGMARVEFSGLKDVLLEKMEGDLPFGVSEREERS